MFEWLLALILAIMAPVTSTEPAQRNNLVALVGDSVTNEHREVIKEELLLCGSPQFTIDAISGRVTVTSATAFGEIESGLEAISKIEENANPSTWIIELGVNDVNSGYVDSTESAQFVIDAVLKIVDKTDVVYWVNTYTEVGRPDGSAIFNQALAAEDRITVIDWASHASPYLYDGLHPTADGARFMASMYCDIWSN